MRLTNEVEMGVGPDELWNFLLDVQRVAPCMPGAALEGSDGDAYNGSVKVKVGPITAAYRGTVRFAEIDRDTRRVVLDAKGAEQHGSGNAQARVVAEVRASGAGCVLALDTDLLIRGKVAQFGRGMLKDVSQSLMRTFAANVESALAQGAPAEAPQPAAAPSSAAPSVSSTAPFAPSAQPAESGELDGLALVATPLLKRAAPVLAGVAVGVLIGAVLRWRRPSTNQPILVGVPVVILAGSRDGNADS